MSSQHPTHTQPVRRALAPALRARLLGSGIVVVALVVLVTAVLVGLAGLPGVVLTTVVGVCAVAVVALLALAVPRHWVLRLDPDGYRTRGLRSTQARSARWSDVRDVQVTTAAGVRCLTLRLRDGRTTTVPVDALEGDPEALVTVVRARLDRTHGYKRLG